MQTFPRTILFVIFCFMGSTWAQAAISGPNFMGLAEDRIFEGENATAGQFPWQVSLILDNTHFCGGALVAPNWVLTSAKCTDRYSKFVVSLGSLYPDSHFVEQTISREKFVHPEYDADAGANDVGLIKLKRNINFTETISSVGIEGSTASFAGYSVRIAGWGQPSNKMLDNLSPILRWTETTVLNDRKCSDELRMAMDNSHLCANTTGICEGDNGGGLVLNFDGVWRLVGVATSPGVAGCGTGTPSVYTRVSQHAVWITYVTGIEVKTTPLPTPTPSSAALGERRFLVIGSVLGIGFWWANRRFELQM